MGRCSLGEVTSEGSKGEKSCEGLGVRLCEGSKFLPSLEATKSATTLLWVLPEDRRPQDQRRRSLLLLPIEQCEYHVPLGLPAATPPPNLHPYPGDMGGSGVILQWVRVTAEEP